MNDRIIPVIILGTACLVALFNLVGIPSGAWSILSSWEIANIAISLAVTFASLLLAYWVFKDWESHEQDYECLRSRLTECEREITKLNTEKTNEVSNKDISAKQQKNEPTRFLEKYLPSKKRS
jgi:hypothetical protein